MLIVKNLKKTYKTKGGVEVHALDDVSITFPENGMVFLLGKSGSGKSTLLNMIGGLDRVDSGEIIVKGKNSKTFSGADYDSYRNTFIGFIFQEYNILNEFNVEQNISLALQLQGKPNDKKAVEEILAQVDLQGLGKRKPNTLSGGQKQRVAIARALIKNPEIIMADEPTGALDSNTGKQVFETLKKLSKDKLVIVVSHDRDFAEYYGDRIVELSDGKIISDTSKEYVEPKAINENVHIINDHTVAIHDTSKLSDSDMAEILKALKKNKGEAVITSGEHDLPLVRQAIHINSDNSTEVFNDTGEVETKEYDPKQTKFIRSKLPMARAFKMGSSSLKLKPVRLIFTSFLTIVALAMFGLASTLMFFRESYSIYKAMQSSDYDSEVVAKKYNYKVMSYSIDIDTGEKQDSYSYDSSDTTFFGVEEVKDMNKNSAGLKYAGLITFGSYYDKSNFQIDSSNLTNYYSKYSILGFSDAGSAYLSNSGLSLTHGSYPAHANEIAISEYQYEIFKLTNASYATPENIINKDVKINLRGNTGSVTKTFKITGIYNPGTIPSKFDDLKDTSKMNAEEARKLGELFNSYMENSFQTVCFVNEEFFDTYKEGLCSFEQNNYWGNPSLYMQGIRFGYNWDVSNETVGPYDGANVTTDKMLDFVKTTFYDLSGNKIDEKSVTLEGDKVYVNRYWLEEAQNNQQRQYYEEINEIVSAKEYNPATYNAVGDKSDEYYSLSSRLSESVYNKDYYPEEHNYDEDVQTANNFIDTYYMDTISKKYTFDMANVLIEGFNTRNGDPESDPSFKTFREYVDEARSHTPYNLSNYNSIKEYVKQDSYKYMRHQLLINLIGGWWSDVSDEDYMRCSQIRDNYYSGNTVTEDDYSFLKEMIEKHVELGRYDTFEYDDSVINKIPPLRENYFTYKSANGPSGRLNVVGYVDNVEMVMSHSFAKTIGTFENTTLWTQENKTDYKLNEDARYSYVITPCQFTQGQVSHMIAKHGSYSYTMTDSTYNNLMMIISLITMLKQIFLISGIVFGVFAALMLLNFISTSIASKIKEIGILRAVGARGSDLFKIFFSESGLIAAICSVIAIIASIITCWRLNVMMTEQVGIALLDFNILNIGLIIAGAIAITIVGTIIPVIIAASKPPVDSIRTL